MRAITVIELIADGEWFMLVITLIPMVPWAIVLTSIKRDREGRKERLKKNRPKWKTDHLDPSLFEVVYRKCFWWGAIVAVFSKTALHSRLTN